MIEVEILALWISKGHDFVGRYGKGRQHHECLSCESLRLEAGAGIVGDRYFRPGADFKGQITFIDASLVNDLRAKGFEVPDPSVFRRNVLIAGVDLNQLKGCRFRLGGVLFSGSEEAKPCFWMDEAVGAGACQSMRGRGGLRCRIHSDGHIRLGPQRLEKLTAHPSRD